MPECHRLVGTKDHMECLGSNPIWLCARHTPYPLLLLWPSWCSFKEAFFLYSFVLVLNHTWHCIRFHLKDSKGTCDAESEPEVVLSDKVFCILRGRVSMEELNTWYCSGLIPDSGITFGWLWRPYGDVRDWTWLCLILQGKCPTISLCPMNQNVMHSDHLS